MYADRIREAGFRGWQERSPRRRGTQGDVTQVPNFQARGGPVEWGVRLPHGLRALDHGDYRRFYSHSSSRSSAAGCRRSRRPWLVLQLTSRPSSSASSRTLQSRPLRSSPSSRVAVATGCRSAGCSSSRRRRSLPAPVAGGARRDGPRRVLARRRARLLLAFANVFDQPARQAYVMDMVGKNDVASAVALNSAAFNAARIVGPAVAGVVIGASEWCRRSLVNSASFLAVIVALLGSSRPGCPRARRARQCSRRSPRASATRGGRRDCARARTRAEREPLRLQLSPSTCRWLRGRCWASAPRALVFPHGGARCWRRRGPLTVGMLGSREPGSPRCSRPRRSPSRLSWPRGDAPRLAAVPLLFVTGISVSC